MKLKSFIPLAAAVCGALLPGKAHATQTDSLTGPSDIEVRQSALTATTTIDPNSQYVTSNRSNSFGNSRFGASYTVTSYTGALGSNASFAYNGASTDATVFGTTKNMLSDAVYAVTSGTAQTATLYDNIYAVGYQIRADNRAGGEFPNGASLSSYSQNLWKSGDQTFWIGPVPVTVSAEVYAGAGQNVQGHFWVDGVTGLLNQYAKLWANAKGGIGVSWAGGGVSVNNLSLVNASLPLNANARFNDYYTSNGCSEWLSLSANYGLSLQELSGEVRIWAKMIFWSDDYQIAKWPGFRQDFTMLNYSGWAWSGTCFPKPAAPVR